MSEPPRTFIIAEAGVNHNGSLELALELVTTAKEAGADAVKFQTFSADRLVTRRAAKAAYQNSALPGDDSQFTMLKALELGEEGFRRISRHCQQSEIQFLSSPFDTQAADMLALLGLRVFKIPSGEITNLPLLRHVGGMKKEVILSTGASWLGEVETAVRTLQDAGATLLTLFRRLLACWARGLEADGPPIPPAATLDSMRLLMMGRRAINEQRKVKLDEFP